MLVHIQQASHQPHHTLFPSFHLKVTDGGRTVELVLLREPSREEPEGPAALSGFLPLGGSAAFLLSILDQSCIQ